MHNYADCRDLCIELLELSYDSGTVVLYLDLPTGPDPIPAGVRTLLFVGGSDQEERGYYCDVVADPGGQKVLISKAELERLVGICRQPERLAGPTYSRDKAPSAQLTMPAPIAGILAPERRLVSPRDASCGTHISGRGKEAWETGFAQ